MTTKFSCLFFFSCFLVMSNGIAETFESGEISFTPRDAIRCWSSSPTFYMPYSMLELDLSKTSSSLKLETEKLRLKIDEKCEMGRYAPPCVRFCDTYKNTLEISYPVLAPLRKFHRQEYIKKFDGGWLCYRELSEHTEVDFLDRKLVGTKVLKEEEVDMAYCQS
jgi:hypothetical protein